MNAPVNPRAVIGGNRPPSPFDAVKAHVEDIYTEAKHWLDGGALSSQEQADQVSVLLDMARKGFKAADEARKTEAKPFDDGKAEVQARYKPILTMAENAANGCKAALAPWLRRLDDEKRAAAEAARKAADEKAAAAAEAARSAQANDLEAREAADALIAEAQRADKAANRAEKDKAAGVGGERAVTLRSYWTGEVTDLREALRHYWAINPDAFLPLVQKLVADDIASGKRTIPGVTVSEDRRPV